MKKVEIVIAICLALAGTAQAGWVQQVSGTGINLRDVSFADSLVGVAVGNQLSDTLLRTTNGGANWLIVTGAGPAIAVDMVTPQIGWSGVGGISKTSNGGQTWTSQYPGGIEAISFSDTLHGIAVDLGGIVLRTTNGGSLWVQETTNVKRDLFDVCMVDSLHAWACGYDGGVDTTSVVVSQDGGQTWTRQRNPINGTSMLTGISFSDTLHGISVGGDQPIQWTENGGVTWNYVWPGDGKYKNDVAMVDSLWAWMVGEPNPGGVLISHTTDGGMNWTVQGPGTTQRLYGVSFVNRRQGWAVGANGTIVHTTDGGVGVEEWGQRDKETRRQGEGARPNPFISFVTILGHEKEHFEAYDITGRRAGTYPGFRVGADLPPGIYFLRVEGKATQAIRVVKVR